MRATRSYGDELADRGHELRCGCRRAGVRGTELADRVVSPTSHGTIGQKREAVRSAGGNSDRTRDAGYLLRLRSASSKTGGAKLAAVVPSPRPDRAVVLQRQYVV